ncbi:maleylacetoacetate isomerase [Amylibacter sp. IMCC11727]|uniref:maleylacetoacetate isomerase n=1 Tax=Amylibacter sp. IMCC11727 TaxID=3039851 RepID=UPI00244DCD1B|nr:maleylacetoacetate isomerase [Amylibacter sp. IMCC11727]WGI22502.1 maleylacetoacetate isomerase [Amylibacter sp. IMCC11727]
MITLYDYWRSSAAYRLRIAFGLAGLDFNAISVDLLTGEHRGAENLARNPQGLVPSVSINDETLTQSLAIIEYLSDAGYHHFLPRAPLDKAHVRALSYAIAMEIHPVCNLSVAKFASENSDTITMKSWMQQFIPKGLTGLEGMLTKSGMYCFGDTVTMADLCLIPQLYNADRWEVDLTPFPKIRSIAENLYQLDAVNAAHPDHFQP